MVKIETQLEIIQAEELQASVAEEVRMIPDPVDAEELIEKNLKEKKDE